ncbi:MULTISPECIES: LysR family transcriptional regulator [unclassified Achromobacter]|uniref:LysR family transcriptional regulator n=1 Tax=unclassified Achromobacter TaxID=2626865 RepID=UPI000B518CA2|nr:MULTISPECIES: LysR family transcriptional regulator [unclassified Achromobacter]OWT67309.1 LysR family transcriptional regulator [Achromobacter sp. HZ34]OWT68044.1 LysR family transcriptional regulator [Achromobacter sp. HZ28]
MKSYDTQIRYFLKIADAGSMSIAAQRLEMTQSALSKQIALLESMLDQALFTRNGRGLVLTAAGEQLKNVATPALEAIDQCIEQLKIGGHDLTGSLRIAAVHTLPFDFIPSLIAQFLAAFPKVNVSIVARSSPEVADLVESGRAEVGFVYDTAVASERLSARPLFTENMCLVCHRDSPIHPGGVDLRAERLPLIVFPAHYALRRMLESANVKHTVVTEVETLDMMLKLASLRLGYCVLPDHLSRSTLAEHHLVKRTIAAPNLSRKLVSVIRKRPTPNRAVERLLNLAVELGAGLLAGAEAEQTIEQAG